MNRPIANRSLGDPAETDRFCREVEAYLCRKNDGHLIRIVGPAFELVSSWAAHGIPLKVAYRGVDRYVERYYAKGPRRRPVRIEFCEADVLDAFDEWRRAVGIGSVDLPEPVRRQRITLSQHLERVIGRLTTRRGAGVPAAMDQALDDMVRELDAHRAQAKSARGEARAHLLQRLEDLDRTLTEAARAGADPQIFSEIENDADGELAAFRDRMSAVAYETARSTARDRLLRERLGLPTLSFPR